jgi:class 3 adenylate cyclase/HAMP domain-containing protein
MKERLNREIFNELLALASVSAELIDGDNVEAMKSIKDFDSEVYRKLCGALKMAVGNNREAWNQAYYAAIYKIIDDMEYFILMSSDEVNMFRPYAVIEEGSGEYDLLTGGKAFASIVDYVDGTWAYSNVPLYNSQGRITGIFEIGLDMTGYEISNALQRQKISFIALFICLVILFAMVLIISFIIKHLRMVVRVLGSIARGDYSVRVPYKAKDELGNVSYGLNSMVEELEKQFNQITRLNESTIRFVPLQFMEHLGVTDITKMKLGDYIQRDLTILFFDIRAFSINSEMMTARENFLFINNVLGLSGPIIRKHNGFVDKFLGDAAMALFVYAKDAVKAGIEVYQKLVLDKGTRIKVGVDGINIGVGLHTGSVMMGIVGENERLSSTVISQSVNLASRVESLTKQTKSGMLITRDTLNQITDSEDEFQYRFIGMIQAAGLNEVVGIYDVLDALPEGIRRRRLATKKVFESGIRKYHMKDYSAAYKRFEQVVKADPSDICAANCLEETRKRLENPKLSSVFVFEKK